MQQDAPAPEPPRSTGISPGTAFLAAFFSIECLPYLLDSFLLCAKKSPLGVPVLFLSSFLCYAVAFGILTLASRLMTGRAKAAPALFLVGLLAAQRAVQTLLVTLGRQNAGVVYALFIAAVYVVLIVTAAAAVKPAGFLFSTADDGRQGGRFVAFLLIFLALVLPSFLDMFHLLLASEVRRSFMGTFSYKLLTALVEAVLLALAAKRLLSRQTAGAQTGTPSSVRLMAGGVLLAASVVITLLTGLTGSVPRAAVYDVLEVFCQGRIYMSAGHMTMAVHAFEQAGEHSKAWLALANGEGYSVPGEFAEDEMLVYLSYLDESPESLRSYLVSSLNLSSIDLWCPLMLEKYAQSEELDEQAQAHRREMLELCIAEDCFGNPGYSMKDIQKNAKALNKSLSADTTLQKDLLMARAFSKAQRGESNAGSLIQELLNAAEEYPNDLTIQFMAAYIGSENRWDNAPHYDATAEAALRFRKLWNEQFGDEGADKVLQNDLAVSDLLMNIGKYEYAARILEELEQQGMDSGELMQRLSLCYTELGETEKANALSKKMYDANPDDPVAIRSYFLSALKGGDALEAVRAASRLAELAKQDPTDSDLLLFNCVTYLTVSDSGSWTGYQYRVYTDDASSEVRTEIAKNEFLDEYCAAVYHGYQTADYEEAMKHIDRALSMQENAARLWYLKGLTLYNQKQFEEAEKALLKADSLDPDDASTHYALANNYDAMGEYQKAYDYCQRVVAKYPNGVNHSEDWYGLGYHAANLLSSLESYVKEGN